MAKQRLDLFVHLGDMSYNDGASVLSEFRDKWQRTLKDPGYRALLPSTGLYAVWDDHEFLNDVDPEAVAPALLEAARAAYLENVATALREGKLWRSFRWGKTAEFFLMDCRTERRPSTRETAQAQYLSPEQLDWLIRGVKASPARFKVLLNSVPITKMPAGVWGAQNDRWQGYAAQREALLSAIEGVEGVLFITGDFHLGLVMKVEQQGPRSRLWEVAVGPGGNGNNPLGLLAEPGADAKNREYAFPKAQFAYATGSYGATTLTFRPRQRAVQVQFFDPRTSEVRFDGTLDV
jgi:alkaline phosphatase D